MGKVEEDKRFVSNWLASLQERNDDLEERVKALEKKLVDIYLAVGPQPMCAGGVTEDDIVDPQSVKRSPG